MRAVTLVAPGEVTVVDDWPEPRCLPGQVIVAVEGVGLCGSDLSVVSGQRPVPRLPWVLGHEAFGVICDVGRDVRDRQVGQRVVIEPNYPCLVCEPCLSGATSGCRERRIVGISEPGLLAERAAVEARFAWPVPDDWQAQDVVCVEPLTVALNAVGIGEVKPGDRCLVVGAGAQGLLMCLAVQHAGGIAYVTEPHAGRLKLALELGAHADDGGGFRVVIETSGVPEAFEAALDRAAPGGTLVVVGQSTRPARIPTFTVVQHRLTVRGCLIYDHPGGFARTLAVLSEDELRPGQVLRARFELAEAPRAFALAADIAGKSWITVTPSEENPR